MVDGYQPPTSPITPVQKVGVWYLEGLSENPEKKKKRPHKRKKATWAMTSE